MAVLNDDVNQLERFLDVGANELILTVANVVFVGRRLLRHLAPRSRCSPSCRSR